MSNTEDAIRIVTEYDSGLLEWREAFLQLRDAGVADHVIREAIGNEPEEI